MVTVTRMDGSTKTYKSLDDFVFQNMPHSELGSPDLDRFFEIINNTFRSRPLKNIGRCKSMHDADHNLISPEQIKARAKEMHDAGLL